MGNYLFTMNKYIIGIDGGGTKTLGVLFDIHGQELKRVENDFSNFSMGEKEAKHHIEKTISELANGLDEPRDLYIQMGIAGVSKLTDIKCYEEKLGQMYHARVSLDSDALIALYAVKRHRNVNVIIVIGGTGSVLMIGEDDNAQIIGGFGHLLGDEGSAYHLVISTFKMIIDDRESGRPDKDLTRKILDKIKAKNDQEIKNFVYNENKNTIANLSMFIAECAKKNDKDAIYLLKKEGKYLAKQTINAYKKFIHKDNVIVALRGGFLLKAPYVKDTLMNDLEKHLENYQIDDNPAEPVIGAYYLGYVKLLKRWENDWYK